jgi:hypothetical protein
MAGILDAAVGVKVDVKMLPVEPAIVKVEEVGT